ncbi:MAG: hypothetical protein Q8M29_02160 [Bacteroidota bacterium]|nr:hypothetical protein [Bacteroidota bacterium]
MSTGKLITSAIANIPIDKVQKEFHDHLAIEGNEKILFSGKYGIGKSYFLDNYFKSEEAQKKYNTVTLSPINYVVSANEDIFELIKVDIIKQLFLKERLKFAVDKDFLPTLVIKEAIIEGAKKVKKKPIKSILSFASNLSKLGVFVGDTKLGIDASLGLIEEFSKFEKELNTKYKPIENILGEYAEEKYQAIGSFLEYNLISKSIADSLYKLKEDERKENILIIEDFDRLDPSHIFRVLNIFSAHNTGNKGNKFGFDKIIIVCDLSNIQGLYEHLYGTKVDFDGYIDKFYSTNPFFFDNKRAIYFYLKNDLKIELDDYAVDVLTDMLATFVSNGHISLRCIIRASFSTKKEDRHIMDFPYRKIIQDKMSRYDHTTIKYPSFIPYAVSSLKIFRSDIKLIEIARFLKVVFSSYESLLNTIKQYARVDKPLNYHYPMTANYIKLFFLAENIMKSDNDKLIMFFSDDYYFHHPNVEKNGVKLYLSLAWSPDKTYKGEGSYFEGSSWRKGSEEATYSFHEVHKVLQTFHDFIVFANNNRWLED